MQNVIRRRLRPDPSPSARVDASVARVSRTRLPFSACVLCACLPVGAAAQVVLPAAAPELAVEQLAIDRTGGSGIGAAIGQEFAQTFELHDTGHVSHVMLPLNCLTLPMPTVRVTVQSVAGALPSGTVLASEDVPGYALDTYPAPTGELGLRMVRFRQPPLLRPGRYAFTFSAVGGTCQLWYGPTGDPYPGGEAFVSTRPGKQPGVPLDWNLALKRDLTFQLFQQPR